MTENLEYMSAKEFREGGYLQELNRILLHPLGLALTVIVDQGTGEEDFGLVLDCRDDPEGIKFSDETVQSEEFQEKVRKVESELFARWEAREEGLGWIVQPVRDIE